LRVQREGVESRRARHWLDRRWTRAGLLLAVGVCVGWFLGAWSALTPAIGPRAWLATPLLMWRAARLRAALPTLRISVDFEGYQSLAETGSDSDAPLDCVSLEIEGDTELLPARACPLRHDVKGDVRMPPVRLDLPADRTLYGMRRAVLAPATPDLALAQQYLHEARSAGIPASRLMVVRLSTNGSSWELYALEELPAAVAVTGVWETPGDAVLSLDPDPGAPPAGSGLGSSFAHALWAVGAAAGDGSGMPPDDPPADADVVGDLARALFAGAVPAEDVVDAELMGRYIALTALWRGVLAPDWAATRFVHDAETGAFAPMATAATHRAGSPLPAPVLWNPEVQRATVRAIQDLAAPTAIERQLRDDGLAALYLALGGVGAESVRDALRLNQSAMRAWVAPARPLHASLVDDPGYLHIALEAIQPYPVEIVALSIAERGQIEVETTWAQETEPGRAFLLAPGLVLRGRFTDVPVAATLRVPIEQLGDGDTPAGPDISVLTRVWGLSTLMPVPVAVEQGDG